MPTIPGLDKSFCRSSPSHAGHTGARSAVTNASNCTAAPTALIFEQGHSDYCSRWSVVEGRWPPRSRRDIRLPRADTIGAALPTQVYHNRRAWVSRTTSCASLSSRRVGISRQSSTKLRASILYGDRPGHRLSHRASALRIKSSTGLAPTRGCSPGSWVTTCALTSSADHPRRSRRRPHRPRGSIRGPLSDRRLGRDDDDDRDPAACADHRPPPDRSRGMLGSSRDSVENLGGADRPIGWTQHVTLGPPYLEQGTTEFHLPATRSKVFEGTFGPADYLEGGAEFDWPLAPLKNGGTGDLRPSNQRAISSAYTAHLLESGARPAVVLRHSLRRRARVRLRVAPRRFSVGRHLGREQQQDAYAVERPDAHEGRRVRRLAVS